MSAATTSQSDSPTRWALVLTAVGAGVLIGFQVGKAPPMIGAIRAELGLDLVQAGFYMSMINGIAVLTGIVAGILSDNAGRRRAVMLGVICLIAGNVLGALADSAALLFASRLLESIAFVGIVVSVPGLILEVTRQRDLGTALSVWSTYMPAGFATMMALGPLLASPEQWRSIWWLNAALGVAYLVLFLSVCRGVGAPPEAARELRGLRAVMARPGPWLLGVCFMLYTVQWFGVLTWLPSIMQSVGLSVAAAGFGVALVVAGNIIGNLMAGVALNRGIPRWAIIAFCSLSLGLLTLGIYDDGIAPVWRLIMAGAFSAIGGAIPGAVLSGSAVHSPTPQQIGLTNGVIVQCTNFGSLIGPPAVALVAASAGGDFTAARWLTLAAGLTGVGVALILRGVERRMAEAG
ncbi:CynX/NimT family MFS transporter [Minwuia sp.]|uniref:MFS transporter n=1 Tax=Minwuia sp. TaxID=2493630 RepID=UPI003A8CA6E3